MADPQTLPQLVRQKYPGVYDDLTDADLDAKVRAAHPGAYDDLPKPPDFTAQNEPPSHSLWQQATTPLVPQIADAAHAIADHLDAPKAQRSTTEAQIRGFLAGATTGTGDLLSGFTSPVGIALMLSGVGEDSAIAKAVPGLKTLLDLPAVRTAQRAVQAGAGTGFLAHGTDRAIEAPTLGGKAQGVTEAALGAAGIGSSGVLPVVGRAAAAASGAVLRPVIRAGAAIADTVPPDVVGAFSPRAGNALRVVQRARNAMDKAPAEAAATRSAPIQGPPLVAPPAAAPVPVAASPVAQVPQPGPVAATPPAAPATTMPPGTPSTAVAPKVLNELAIQARRAGVKLSDADYEVATKLVAKGATPNQAVKVIAGLKQAPSDVAPPSAQPDAPSVPAAAKPSLTASETTQFLRLKDRGMSDRDAYANVLAMRQLVGKIGAVTDAGVRADMGQRAIKGQKSLMDAYGQK